MSESKKSEIMRLRNYAQNERAKAALLRKAGKHDLAKVFEDSAVEYETAIKNLEEEKDE